MAEEDMVCQQQALVMPRVAWQLLGQYHTVLDYDRRTRLGRSKINYKHTAGALLAKVLIDNAPQIRRAAEEIRLQATKEAIPGFYTPDQLAAIASAARTDIPDVFRIDSREREKSNRQKARRTLLLATGKSSGSPAGSAGKPRKVRKRSRGASSRTAHQ